MVLAVMFPVMLVPAPSPRHRILVFALGRTARPLRTSCACAACWSWCHPSLAPSPATHMHLRTWRSVRRCNSTHQRRTNAAQRCIIGAQPDGVNRRRWRGHDYTSHTAATATAAASHNRRRGCGRHKRRRRDRRRSPLHPPNGCRAPSTAPPSTPHTFSRSSIACCIKTRAFSCAGCSASADLKSASARSRLPICRYLRHDTVSQRTPGRPTANPPVPHARCCSVHERIHVSRARAQRLLQLDHRVRKLARAQQVGSALHSARHGARSASAASACAQAATTHVGATQR